MSRWIMSVLTSNLPSLFRSELSPDSRLVAQKLDVLIAFAWRDEKRIVAAAKRLFDASPRLVLSDFPKDLVERIEPYRPAPPKPSSITTQLSYRLKLLAPSSLDGSQWLPGEGARFDLGYFDQQRVVLGPYSEAIQHYARSEFSYDTLSMYEFGLTWRQPHSGKGFGCFGVDKLDCLHTKHRSIRATRH